VASIGRPLSADQRLALVARVRRRLAEVLLDGAAIFDLALGIGTLALSARSRARLPWRCNWR
jgi:hypothetical protein